jgi:SPW repeat
MRARRSGTCGSITASQPPEEGGKERKHAMSTPLIRRPESNGASAQAVPAMASGPAEYALPATASSMGAQTTAVLALLTGLWVAVSPWFLTLQSSGTNANFVNLISGLAVAGVGVFALVSPRGFAGLELGSALLGVWLIIAGPILSQKHPIADSMFWSNSWAGGVLIALAATGLAAVALRRPARS